MTEFIPSGAPLRELLLIIEAIVAVLAMQMGFIYVRKFFKTKSNFTILAWGELLFAFSAVFLMYLVSDFYTDISTSAGVYRRELVLNIAYLIGAIGVFLFSYNTEREIQYKKHALSIVVLIIIGLLIIKNPLINQIPFFLYINTSILSMEATFFTMMCWSFFIIIVIIYIKKFTAKISEKWRINVYSLIIGTIFVILGFGATADIAVSAFGGFWIRCLGDCLVIAGILFISALFIGVPSLAEFEWAQKIRYLNIIHQSGVSIGYYNFTKGNIDGTKTLDELLMAGGLTSISQVVSEIIESEKKLDFVDHGDIKLLFEYGKYLINVLVVDELLVILRSKLKKFTEQMEFIYEDNLAAWNGDLEQFKFMDALVKSNFEHGKK